MSKNTVTWESLDGYEQLALELLLEGDESLLTPNAGRVYDGLIAKGLVGRNWNDIRGMYFVLTDAALALMSTATPAPTDDLARLQTENERLRAFAGDVNRALEQLPYEMRMGGEDMALDTIPKLIDDWNRLRAEAAEEEVRTILAALKKHCKDSFVIIIDGGIDWQRTIAEFTGYIQLDARKATAPADAAEGAE